MLTDNQKLVEFMDRMFIQPLLEKEFTKVLADQIGLPAADSTFTQAYAPLESLTAEIIREACNKLFENHTTGNLPRMDYHPLGIRLIESPYAVTKSQFRFPRTKKKRILKKWGKKEINFRNTPCIYDFAGKLVCHPAINLEKYFAKVNL